MGARADPLDAGGHLVSGPGRFDLRREAGHRRAIDLAGGEGPLAPAARAIASVADGSGAAPQTGSLPMLMS